MTGVRRELVLKKGADGPICARSVPLKGTRHGRNRLYSRSSYTHDFLTVSMEGVQLIDDLSKRILDEIDRGESNNVEFKSNLPGDDRKYLKTVVAFSNGAGGRIFFGVGDDRSIIGIPDDVLFKTMDSIADSISSSCRPMISPDIFNVTVDDKNIIVVDIRPGRDTPYFIESEGRSRGTYIRVAGISKVADQDILKSLEIRGSRESFDRLECPSVEVDRDSLSKLCRRLSGYSMEISPVKLENMRVISPSFRGYMATNAYALLTINPFLHARIQCACFRDADGLVFADSMDFGDDIVSQVEGAHRFVLRHLTMSSEISGLVRKDSYEIPEAAIREAIVNAVVHRDYSMQSCSIFVRVFGDRVEIESPGLLLIDLSEIGTGRSEIRNQAIASVFKAMGFIERYGKGTHRMIELCKEQGCRPPMFRENGEFFKVVFSRPVQTHHATEKDDAAIIIRCILEDPSITQPQIAQVTGISLPMVKKIMARLRENGTISRSGSRKTGVWIVNDPVDI